MKGQARRIPPQDPHAPPALVALMVTAGGAVLGGSLWGAASGELSWVLCLPEPRHLASLWVGPCWRCPVCTPAGGSASSW